MNRFAFTLLMFAALQGTPAIAEAVSDWEKSLEAAESAVLKNDDAHVDENIERAMSQTGDDDTIRATIQNQVGIIRMRQHRYADAQKAFQTALDLRLSTVGPSDPATLQTEGNLGLAEVKLGNEVKAEELYKKAIEGKRKTNPTSPSLATSLTNLAHLLAQEKRCREAKTLYIEALGIDSTEYGATHAEVAQDLFNLGAMLEECNNFTEALPYLERSKRTYEALKDDLGKSKSLHYIALCYTGMHQPAKASEASLAAFETHEHFKGKGHGDTLVHLLNAADSVDAMGEGPKAQKLYQQALQSAEAAKEPSNLRLAECNLEMGEFFLRHNEREKAEQYFKSAIVHYDALNKRDRRTLYELPLVYVKLLQDAHRDTEADELSTRYIDVFLPTTTASSAPAPVLTPAATPDAPVATPDAPVATTDAPAATPAPSTPPVGTDEGARKDAP